MKTSSAAFVLPIAYLLGTNTMETPNFVRGICFLTDAIIEG